jgi:hypothetical protein
VILIIYHQVNNQEAGDLSPKATVDPGFLISVRTQGQVGYRRRNRSASGCLPANHQSTE